ncbi:MAG: hypothetical protein AB8I08_20630 [Sandaracinaceae bacterium]
MRRLLGTASLLAVLLTGIAPPASADMAGLRWPCASGTVERERTFPPGTLDPMGRPQRPVSYCAITTCESDADCDGGAVCSQQEVGLCVQGAEPMPPVIRVVNCDPSGQCPAENAVCERARRCVEPGSEATRAEPTQAPSTAEGSSPPAPRSSGLCTVGHTSSFVLWAVPLMFLALLWRRR